MNKHSACQKLKIVTSPYEVDSEDAYELDAVEFMRIALSYEK